MRLALGLEIVLRLVAFEAPLALVGVFEDDLRSWAGFAVISVWAVSSEVVSVLVVLTGETACS